MVFLFFENSTVLSLSTIAARLQHRVDHPAHAFIHRFHCLDGSLKHAGMAHHVAVGKETVFVWMPTAQNISLCIRTFMRRRIWTQRWLRRKRPT